MKKIAILLCNLLFSCLLYGQVKYEIVYASIGSRILNKETGEYDKLSVETIVEPEDKLYSEIEKGIHLIELTTGKPQVYQNIKEGYMTVSELVVGCNKQNSSILRRIISTASESSQHTSDVRWSSVGAGTRHMHTNDLASIIRRDLLSKKKNKVDKKLQLIKCKIGNLFYPKFVNETLDTLFVNFIAVDKKNESIAVCFNIVEDDDSFGIKLPPNSTCTLQGFNYIDSKKYQYVVFGTKESFNAYELSRALKMEGSLAQENNTEIIVKYGVIKQGK